MKNLKRFLALFLVLTMVLPMAVITSFAAPEEDEDPNWQISTGLLNKQLSRHRSNLDGFTVEFAPVHNGTKYPETISLVWTNQFDVYNDMNEYSALSYGGEAVERFGWLWDAYVPKKEYTYTITLMDYLSVYGVTYQGTNDDGIYDVIVYSSICRGDFWAAKAYDKGTGVNIPANQNITVTAHYEYSEDDEAYVLGFSVNGKYFVAQELANSQSSDRVYHFGIAAYNPGQTAANAAQIELLSVNGEEPESFTGYPYCDHTYESEVTTPATCAPGLLTYTCTKGCGDMYTEEIPGTGEHTYEAIITTPATCIQEGVRSYICSVCGDTYTEAIPTTDHTWGELTVTTPPTCTEEGEGTQTCTVCGETETGAVPAAGHEWTEWIVTTPPTCTEDGVKTRICTVCAETETDTVPATGHTWGAWDYSNEPTCTEDGEGTRTCTVCGVTETDTVPATGHTWSDWVTITGATCTAEGEEGRICLVCELIETRAIPMVPHTWGNWITTVESTCIAEGTKERTCSVCGLQETEALPLGDHAWENWTIVTAPTKTTEGTRERVCSVCEEVESVTAPFETFYRTVTEGALNKYIYVFESYLDGFTVEFMPLNNPYTVSLAWTTEFDNYDGVNEYSAFGPGLGPDPANARFGFLWNNYIAGKEYTYNVTLMDVLDLGWHVYPGTPNDGKYNVVSHSVINKGNYWATKVQDFSAGVEIPMDAPITLTSNYAYSEDDDAYVLGVTINGDFFVASQLANSQLSTKSYHFGIAAYNPNQTAANAADVELLSVNGRNPATFAGQDPGHEHAWGEWEVITEATCIEEGERIRTCTECEETETETIPLADHTPGEWEVVEEAGYSHTGLEVQTCTVCEAELDEREIPRLEAPTDVLGKWFEEYVRTVMDAGLMEGYPDGTFRGDNELTRAMFVTTLANIDTDFDSEVYKNKTIPFTDVADSDWFKPYVAWAFEKGLVKGVTDTTFGPDMNISREQMALIMFKMAEYLELDTEARDELTKYTDKNDISSWALEAVKWAVAAGLISGMTETTIGPNSTATRGQVATILTAFLVLARG